MPVTVDAGFVLPPSELHEDNLVLEPVWYSGGPYRSILVNRERDPQRFYYHGWKISALAQPDQPCFQDVLTASSPRDLCQVGYGTILNGLLMAFAKRWHPETSLFHLLHGEITIILDDVACLLHLPIRGTLLGHGRLTKKEAMETLIDELGANPDDALEEVERTRGAHVRFAFLQQRYHVDLLATQEVVGDEVEEDVHRERALRCYFLYLIGTHLFVDTSLSYTEFIYLTYLLHTTCIHEYNWGAIVLAYNYYRLGEGYLWKARTVAWILQHFPYIIGWGEVPAYTELMPRASTFSSFRGNQVSDPYRRGLDSTAADDVHYDCYAEHCETVPFDEISLYSRWLALERVMRQFDYARHDHTISAPIAVTHRQLDEVFVDWEHHMVPEEARATRAESDWSCVEGYITWYYRMSHSYMFLAAAGDPPRPTQEEILRTHQAEFDHTQNLLPRCL
ncbi:protein MAIN-LIKE 1-like [Vicia villosa]|uniref:protein MAIN-LIKE 1-like n=1 Tax=Vicia villosa TaxID=3911 RepID=UPI00273AEA9D|nr:protein MAIN-LIKE 1-like [Vicia villosa]